MKGKAKVKKGKKADGGRVGMKVSGNPDVFKEAEDRQTGGRVKAKAPKSVGFMTGGGVKPRLDRPVRRSGGRVGADKAPLSSAHGSTAAETMPKSQDGGASD